MKRTSWSRLLLAALVSAGVGAVAGCGGDDEPPKPRMKVALVGEGSIEDNTYNKLIYDGVAKAANDFDMEFDFLASQPSSFAKDINTFADEGYDHIITVAFPMATDTIASAESHPNSNYAMLDFPYDGTLPNVMGFVFREDQGGFIAGSLAGLKSTSKKVGCLGGVAIPAIKRFCNGFASGVKHTCASCTTLIEYSNSFGDAAEGQTRAQTLIAGGADVIFGAAGFTGSMGIKYAAEQGVWVIGVDQDEYFTTFQSGEHPNANKLLTSILKKADVAAYKSIEETAKGTFTAGSKVLSVADGALGLAPYHEAAAAVPSDMQASLNAVVTGLGNGSINTRVNITTGEPQP